MWQVFPYLTCYCLPVIPDDILIWFSDILQLFPGNAEVELAVFCSSLLLYPTHSGSLIAITLIIHGPPSIVLTDLPFS